VKVFDTKASLVLIVYAKPSISQAYLLLHNGLTTLNSCDLEFTMDAEFLGTITIEECELDNTKLDSNKTSC